MLNMMCCEKKTKLFMNSVSMHVIEVEIENSVVSIRPSDVLLDLGVDSPSR